MTDRATLRKQVRRQKALEEYLVEHGELPQCECGCGQEVNIGIHTLKPNRFVNGHGSRVRPPEVSGCVTDAWRQRNAQERGYIPQADFRRAVQKLKEQKGITLIQMAEIAGMNPGTLQGRLWDPRKKHVSREWARQFFARLAGMPYTPTKYDRARLERIAKAENSLPAFYQKETA